MPKTGEQWISSRSRRSIELAIVTTAAPGIGLAALVACGALRLENGSASFISQVERSLYPGQRFMMRKLGDPHSNSRVNTLCRKAMIDEIPQFAAIVRGDMALFGPRADAPDHVENTFTILQEYNQGLFDATLVAHARQKPGLVSSYAIYSHAHNLDGLSESQRFPHGTALEQNALFRGTCDTHDYISASFDYEKSLLISAASMVRHNYAHYAQTALAK